MAQAFEPGDHGTTFGGNPFATAAGLGVFEIYEEEKILENVKAMSAYFMSELEKIKEKHTDKIVELRNAGLLIGIELKGEYARDTFNKMFENKYLTSLCKNTLRIAPPLIITKQDIDGFINVLDEIL